MLLDRIAHHPSKSHQRRIVSDGDSPKRSLYCCAKRPRWKKPQRVATSVMRMAGSSAPASRSVSDVFEADLADVGYR